MAIYSMSITHSKIPIIFDITKVLDVKTRILIFFIRLIRYFPFRSLSCNFVNWILKTNINNRLSRCLTCRPHWICNLNRFNWFWSLRTCSSFLRHIHWSRLNVRLWSNLNLISIRSFWACSCSWVFLCLAQWFYWCGSLSVHVKSVICASYFRV